MRVNNLPANCGSFPRPGTSICLPETCRVHTILPLDTCKKIANAAGTWSNCTHYVTYMVVPTDASYLEFSNPNYCVMRASIWKIELQQLLLWNPSLPEMLDETVLNSCMLEEGFRYCVAGGGGSIPSGPSTTLPPSSLSAAPSSSVSSISSPVPTPNSNDVLGTGPGEL